MKKPLAFLILMLAMHFSFGQACGIYRIKYTGLIASNGLRIVRVQLPTTLYLHGIKNDKSDLSFNDAKLANGNFNLEIGSHLTTPYDNKEALISCFKSKSQFFVIRVYLMDGDKNKRVDLDVKWDDIEVSIINDGKLGALFEFRFKEIII